MNLKNVSTEIIGWYGTIAIIVAYILLSFGIISAGILYQLLNLTGAVGIVLVSFKKGATQPGVLNLVWTFVALVAIVKLLK